MLFADKTLACSSRAPCAMRSSRIHKFQRWSDKDKASFFQSIRKGNCHEVEKFAEKYPWHKFIFSEKRESPPAVALKAEQLRVYQFLITQGFRLGPHENINELLTANSRNADGESLKKRRKLREIHKLCVKDPMPRHLAALHLKSKLSHNTPRDKNRKLFELIARAFDALNELKWIESILQVAANARDLWIIFDFNCEFIGQIDPTKSKNTKGTMYPSSRTIFIGAKHLLDDKKRFVVYGTLAHELCHYAMEMLYNNNCKPYCATEAAKKEEFTKIAAACEMNKFADENIASVYRYSPLKQHSELIARVPQIIALYKLNADKHIRCEEKFVELFSFYERNTLADLNREYPLIEAKQEVMELNELCGTLSSIKRSTIHLNAESVQSIAFNSCDKVISVLSNCPQLTINSLYSKPCNVNVPESSHIFVPLDALSNEKIFALLVKAFQSHIQPTIVVDCKEMTNCSFAEIIWKLYENGLDRRIVFIFSDQSKYQLFPLFGFEVRVKHSWSQLMDNARQQLMECGIIFQGTTMALKDILKENSASMNEIPLAELMSKNALIVGEQIAFKGIQFHVERNWIPKIARFDYISQKFNVEYTNDEIIRNALQRRIILLADEPGNGKTTALKVITIKLKEKFPSHWIVYIDLKEFVGAYRIAERSSIAFETRERIAEFLSEQILKIEGFEARVFQEMFNNDCAIIITDGFDEISPSFNRFISDFITAIRQKTKNQLWISSRSHLSAELEQKLNVDAYKLKPFSEENQRKFFELFSKGNLCNESDALDIDECLSTLKLLSWNGTITNPMLLRMIVEILSDNIRPTPTLNNRYTIYNEFVNKMLERFMEKGFEAKNDLRQFTMRSPNILEFHQQKALETIFMNDCELEKLIRLSFGESSSSLSVEQMVRIGLMYGNATNQLHFIHRTFAEFFVATFFLGKVFKNELQTVEERESITRAFVIFLEDPYDVFKTVKLFIDNALKTFDFAIKSDDANRISIIFREIYAANRRLRCLHALAENGCINIIRIISLSFSDDLKKLFPLWLSQTNKNKSVLMAAAEYQGIDVVKKLWAVMEEVFKKPLVKALMREKFETRNIFHYAAMNEDLDVFFFFLEKAKSLIHHEDFHKLLTAKDEHNENILFYAVRNNKSKAFKRIFEVVKANLCRNKLSEMLKASNVDGWNLFDRPCRNYDHEDLSTFCSTLSEYLTTDELKKLCLSATHFNETALMCVLDNDHDNVFQVFSSFIADTFDVDTQKEILMKENRKRETALHYAVESNNIQLFQLAKSLFESLLGTKAMMEIMMRENVAGESILFSTVKQMQRCDEKFIIAELWNYLKSLLDNAQLKELLTRRNKNGKTFIEILSYFQLLEKNLNTFMPFIVEKLSEKDARDVGLL